MDRRQIFLIISAGIWAIFVSGLSKESAAQERGKTSAQLSVPPFVSGVDWAERKSSHFFIYYIDGDYRWAEAVLSQAEQYYAKISNQIGYGSLQQVWTWEHRVRIYIFPDQKTFQQKTGWPAWSQGGVTRQHHPEFGKIIVSFKQDEQFKHGVLPHEISHLMLREFMGKELSIPLWLEEGMAQLQETDKKEKAEKLMKVLVDEGGFIPFVQLFQHDIRRDKDQNHVAIFYTQSVSILDFLIQEFGVSQFQRFCRSYRDKPDVEKILLSVYAASAESIEDLEKKWVRYIKNK
jgi:hypothetical protein